jgi:large-conductance mechanosensitive channel
MTKIAIQFFFIILAGSLLSALIGGGFGAIVGVLSPDFVNHLFASYQEELAAPVRYAFSVGLIWGLFIGAAVTGFSCALSVFIKLVSTFPSRSKVPSQGES